MPVRLLQVLVLATLAVCRPLSSTVLATSRPVLLRRTNFTPRVSCPPLAVAVSPPLASADTADADAAPPSLTPIYLGVFTQMLSEGIAIGTLPLHMTLMGGSPLEVAAATSCFSVMQMLLCPLLVALSSAIGDRETILRVCLLGATMSGVLLSLSNSVYQIIFARLLAGAFAASVPVAQAAVTDVVTGNATAAALARVSAAAQSGVVAGPAVAAFLLPAFGYLGVPSAFRLRCVFALSSSLALGVLALSSRDVEVRRARRSRRPKELLRRMREERAAKAAKAAAGAADRGGPAARLTQPVLRLVAVLIGWSLTLSVSTYGLFAPRFLGFAQPQLSASYSAGAAVTLGVQLALFPRLVSRFGAHLVATAGLLSVSGAMASMVVCRAQPWHSALYLLNRASSGVADTSVATLVALASTPASRAANLALIQSSRAAARIFSPLASSTLFQRSFALPAPGALPYLVVAACLFAVAPLPLALRRLAANEEREGGGA